MKQYMRRKENKELYEILQRGGVRVGENQWKSGICYRKVVASSEPNVFFRDDDSVHESFVTLKTIECSHRLVSFDLVYDPAFPVDRATSRSIGIDVRTTVTFVLAPGERRKVPTGVSWNVKYVDSGFRAELQGRPRSGNADKKGLSMVNCVGTIDEDYCGEIHAILINLGQEAIEMKAGDKVAQLILGLSPNCDGLDEITADRERGSGGFGSTDLDKVTNKTVADEGFRNSNCHAVATRFLKHGLSKHSTVAFLITNQPYAPLAVSDIMSIVDEAEQMLQNETRLGGHS
jgi:dUTP pyrophosphatase